MVGEHRAVAEIRSRGFSGAFLGLTQQTVHERGVGSVSTLASFFWPLIVEDRGGRNGWLVFLGGVMVTQKKPSLLELTLAGADKDQRTTE